MQFIKKMRNTIFISALLFMILAGTNTFAKNTIRFASVSWTGVTVKTELGVMILKSLGYDASNIMVSVPIALTYIPPPCPFVLTTAVFSVMVQFFTAREPVEKEAFPLLIYKPPPFFASFFVMVQVSSQVLSLSVLTT